MHRIAFCLTNRLFILLERAETEIRFSTANGTFKMKMDIDRHGPRLCPTTVKILSHLISRYQLHLSCFFGNRLCTNSAHPVLYMPGMRPKVPVTLFSPLNSASTTLNLRTMQRAGLRYFFPGTKSATTGFISPIIVGSIVFLSLSK